MARNENVITVRLSEDVLQKLDELIQWESEDALRIGGKPINRKEIIEESLRDLYYKKINRSQDADVVERINGIVEDRVNASLSNLHRKIDEICYLTIKNDLGNKLLYRSPSVLPSPPEIDDAIEIIVNEESRWNNALDRYMMESWKKKKKEVE